MRYAKGTFSLSASRDIPLLLRVRNSRFVSHQQLFELLTLSALEYSRQSFNWRVQRLIAGNYLEICSGEFGHGSSVYRITRGGLAQLENYGHFATTFNSKTPHLPHISQAHHALELVAIELELARNKVLVSWKSDLETASLNVISEQPFVKDYDAVVDVWNDQTAARFAVEYERTLKSAQQYERIRRVLEKEDTVGCILYLTAGEEISLHLARELAGIPKRLAFATSIAFRTKLLDTLVTLYPGQPQVTFRTQLHGVF